MHSSVGSPAGQDNNRSIDPQRKKFKARLRREVEISEIPQKAFAYGLKTSEAQLTRYLGDQYPNALHDHELPAVTRELGPGYMEWLAIQCGGVYHHGEHAPHCHQSVVVVIGLLAKQSGAVVQQLLQDLKASGKHDELPGLRRLKILVETLIADVEGSEA